MMLPALLFTLALAHSPEDAIALHRRAMASGDVPDAWAAVEAYGAQLEEGVNLENARFLRAELYWGLWEFESAYVDYARCARDFPTGKRVDDAVYNAVLSAERAHGIKRSVKSRARLLHATASFLAFYKGRERSPKIDASITRVRAVRASLLKR